MILYFLNSDFGVQNTYGARALHSARIVKKQQLKVFCRNYNNALKNKFDIVKVVPFGSLIMKLLTGIPIYITYKFPSNKIKIKIFEFFLKKKLEKINLSKVKLIHSWDFLPDIFKYIKDKNPKIKIIQDVPIALPNIWKDMKDKKELLQGTNIKTPKYMKKSLKYIDLFVVPSKFVKKSLLSEGVTEKKICVMPFGVDAVKFKPIKKDYNDKFKVAFVGNINNRKGIKYLLEAWKELNLKNSELNLYGRVYPEASKYLKNVEKVNVHGFVDIKKKLPKNHIYVFPSLMEGSSKSVYEALASGLPVITTFNSGSVVRDGKEGFIIPVQNVKILKQKIEFFYNNRNQVRLYGRRARLLAEKYTWENYGKNFLKIYN